MFVNHFFQYSLLLVVLLFADLSGAIAQNLLSFDSPAHQKTEKVYKKMREAAGDFRRDLPQLILMERVARVASYRSSDNVLIIEKKAFDICESMGKDAESALAFLIGHELTHFYQQHDWEETGFGTTFLAEKEVFTKHAHDEAEADVYGAFVAYVAGYNTLDIVPTLLDKIYTQYKLAANMADYPSLAERKAVTEKVRAKVTDLINVYDNANYFAALGWHSQAMYCYEYLLKFLKTKELYNNMGMVLTAIAIQQRSVDTYWYPLEVDLDNALRGWAEKTQSELLEEASRYLEKALTFDKSYFAAHLNFATVLDLQKQYKKAGAHLELAEKYSKSIIDKANVAIVEGIVLAHSGDKISAESSFEKAHKYTVNSAVRMLVAHNLKVLNFGKSSLPTEPMTRMEDMLDGIPLLESPPAKFQQSIVFSEGFMGAAKMHFNHYAHSEFACLESKLPFDAQQAHFALQRTQQLATRKGIRAGNAVSLLKKTYDHIQMPRTVRYRDGYFLIYRSLGLVFKVNNQELIEEWALFLSY